MSRKITLSFYFVMAAALVFSTACGKKEEPAKPAATGAPAVSGVPGQSGGQAGGALPSGHPSTGAAGAQGQPGGSAAGGHPSVKNTKEVRVTKEVAAKWKEVEIEVKDSKGGAQTLKIAVGSQVNLKDGFAIKVLTFLPEYMIFGDYVSSKSNDPNNPAVMLELFDGKNSVAKGWIFKKPEFAMFNSFKNDRFSVTLLTPRK